MTQRRPLAYLGIDESNPPQVVTAQRAPATTDVHGYDIGDIWINEAASTGYQLVSKAAGVATWSLMTPGSSNVNTINSLAPALGDIVLAGGTNLTAVSGGNTVTLNLDDAISLVTSVTSPLFTASAVDVAVSAPAGKDVIIKLGDAAGANKFSIIDSASAEVFNIDSNGVMSTSTGSTITGIFTQTAGAVNIGQDNAANAINIGGGNVARAITLGKTGAHTVAIGSAAAGAITVDSAAGLSLDGATASNFTVSAAGEDLTLSSTLGRVIVNAEEAAANAITLLSAAGGLDTNVALQMNLDSSQAAATAVRIVASNAAGGIDIDCGTGGCTLDSTGVLSLDSAGATNLTATGAFDVTVSSTLGSVIVSGGEAAADAVQLTSSNAAGGVLLTSGTGGIAANAVGAAAPITLDAVGVIELNSSGAAIGIGNDAANFAVNVGTAGTRTVTLGSATTTSSTVIQSGTGAANFASNATVHATTLGSVTGASATTIQAGTGKITMTGTVKEVSSDYMTRTGDSITFYASPIVQSAATTGAAPSGATGDINLVSCREGVIMEEFVLGAGQTILAPRMNANGLRVSGDLTAGEGYEYNFGAARTNSRHAFTIGTSAAFMFELRFRINDMDGAAPYVFGFRKSEANNATYGSYSDYCGIGLNAATSPTKVLLYDELNGGGVTITNTTDDWGGDGTTNTLQVLVSAAGAVTYTINGAAPSVGHAFTFDNADVVVPYIRIEHSASPTEVDLVSMKIGYQV